MEFPKRFKLSELVRTDTGLPNVPGWEEAANLRKLALYLDRVREAYGSDDAFARLLAALETVKPETVDSGSGPVALDQLIVYCRKPKDIASGIRFFHVGVSIDGKPRRQVIWK